MDSKLLERVAAYVGERKYLYRVVIYFKTGYEEEIQNAYRYVGDDVNQARAEYHRSNYRTELYIMDVTDLDPTEIGEFPTEPQHSKEQA
ncbi:MAG: hypothetical protein GY847_38725 [Proteobacteria bacterium]|nr:hypothetical protein [Pseudomonadota bacterium]